MALLGLAILLPAMPAAAAINGFSATPLVNSGQPIRDASTAIPIFGMNATTSAADLLTQITVTFSGTGFVAGNSGTLLALNQNPASSGLALYRDSGSSPYILDAGDVGVSASSVSWSGNAATLNFAESVPSTQPASYVWILVLRTNTAAQATSGTPLAAGVQIIPSLQAASVVFSTSSFPGTAVTASALTVSPTAVVDLLAPRTWIGPSTVAVNARAVLGIQLIDGGIPVNHGVRDQLARVVVQFYDNSGTFGGNKFLAFGTNPATSGMALYRDSNGNGAWDAGDAGVTLTAAPTINCVGAAGGAAFDICLSPSAEFVPHALPGGAYSYFVVVRSGTAMASGDDFSFQILRSNGLRVSGVHGDDASRFPGMADVLSSSLLGDNTPPCITAGCGSPVEPRWANPTSSPYLYPVGRTLFFGHLMGATPVPGQIRLAAGDGESGLARAAFSTAACLAGTPPTQVLSGAGVFVNVYANYSFNAMSTSGCSPAVVTVFDAVGNSATLTYAFVLDTTKPVITPNPGWTNLPGGEPFYLNATGTLWFSPWIAGTVSVDITQDISDFGSGLGNATGSVEASLAGGPNYAGANAWGPGVHFVFFALSYDFNASSTDTSRPVTVVVCDHVANCANVSYDYRLDATVPAVTITSPSSGSILSGQVVITAQASDAGSGLAPPPQLELMDAVGNVVLGFSDMFWNGAAWAFPVQTALFPDGSYRIVVEAFDNVGGVGAAIADVTFHNSVLDTTPPSLSVNAPTPYAYVSGALTVSASATDAGGFGTSGGVWAQLGPYTPVALTASGSTWSGTILTSGIPDGPYTLTIWATDAAGNTARVSFPITLDNTPPALAFIAPGSNALVSGIAMVRVSALDSVGVGSVSLGVGSSSYAMASEGSGVYAYALDTTALTGGSVTVTVTATDLAGHATTKTLAILVDNAGPSITLGTASSDRGAITLTATVSDTPAGVASVVFVVDGNTYTGVADGSGGYSVTIWTTQADNGMHSYEVLATDRAGNTAMASATFSVNNPADYYAAFVAFAPAGIFLVLLVALIVGLLLLLRRRKQADPPAAADPAPAKPAEDEL